MELTLIVEPRAAAGGAAGAAGSTRPASSLTTGGAGSNSPSLTPVNNYVRTCQDYICRCEDGRSGNAVCTESRCRNLSGCLGGSWGLTCDWHEVPGTKTGSWEVVAIPLALLCGTIIRDRWKKLRIERG